MPTKAALQYTSGDGRTAAAADDARLELEEAESMREPHARAKRSSDTSTSTMQYTVCKINLQPEADAHSFAT